MERQKQRRKVGKRVGEKGKWPEPAGCSDMAISGA